MSAPQAPLKASPEIITLGCRLNTLESEVMRDELAKAGIVDAIIINTCAVTGEAERQARQTIRRLKRERPDARIIVTGCAAQLDPAKFAAMAEVDRVVGNADKLDAATLLGEGDILVSDIHQVRETAGHLVSGIEGRTRAFVMVQQGCDNSCTFCIIPAARGPNRAAPIDQITRQVAKLVAAGHNEVVLTGVDIAAYGADLGLCGENGTGLTAVIRNVLAAAPQLKRLRLSSLDPARLDDDFFRLLADEPRLMAHLHLSLQAADDMVLTRMKRRHRVADIETLMARARAARPDVVFGADLIAGFPTETDDLFATTLTNISRWDVQYLHVFPYSARPGTPAARMPQVPGDVAKARAKHLRDAGDAALARHLQNLVGTVQPVLLEKPNFGRTESFAEVTLSGDGEPGTIIDVRLTGSDATTLTGEYFFRAAE
ncbi:MAG: tRNA (N(6)-L-threonylcarbamoyladenosine(37)-C(2))-methylthiotransferase MtaB [Rhodospirillales bacterium]|nr:tRNA (N(6)-L-threonylcarbamoyladenosine(37)-C(2))-methylthiotransferase MtaB [Rhodospirillales bacterium]